MPFRNSSLFATHVADAITTRPVLRSTAMTDQVADAVDGTSRSAAAGRIHRSMRRIIHGGRARRNGVDLMARDCTDVGGRRLRGIARMVAEGVCEGLHG